MTSLWDDYNGVRFYDELIQPDGRPRTGCADVLGRIQALGPEILERQRAAEAAIRSMGITFTLYTEDGSIDRSWPVDVIPRILPLHEWNAVSAGLIQRLEALNCFVNDLYHEQKIIADGQFPADLLAESPNYREICRGIAPPGGTWAHISGSDLVRDGNGTFFVLEDNLRIPSGVSYMLENRQVSKRVFADLFRDIDVQPVDTYTDRLAAQLSGLSPRQGIEPVIAVLTPGIFNSAYYEHVLLASRMGAHLVEGSDLVVDDDNVVHMRTVSGLVRVDVIYRRVDDLFLDPEVFIPDSTLGVPGLIRAWRAGNVAIANAPGVGVADDKVVYSYVPDIIRYYLGEEPKLANVPTWRCGEPEHLSHVLANLDTLVTKPANEAGGKGVTIGPKATAAELDEVRAAIEADPRNWVAQPVLSLSTAPTICGDQIAPRHLDLRPFILSGADPYVTMGGLTRVALKEGSLIVNSSQGGGSKDTWIVNPDTDTARIALQAQVQTNHSQSQTQTATAERVTVNAEGDAISVVSAP
ncbi:MAG: circularly permuted type 2 ATP-grasp protein [Actinomycetota bacterium]